MTSKQRAYLKSLAMTMEPIFQIGKSSLTPEVTAAITEALEARELIKINVLQNCADDANELARMVAERTRSLASLTAASGTLSRVRGNAKQQSSISTVDIAKGGSMIDRNSLVGIL